MIEARKVMWDDGMPYDDDTIVVSWETDEDVHAGTDQKAVVKKEKQKNSRPFDWQDTEWFNVHQRRG